MSNEDEPASRIVRFSAKWAVSLIGTVISLGGTVASLLFGVDGALSVTFGLGGIAISLLLEALSELNSTTEEMTSISRRATEELQAINNRLARTERLLDVWQRGGDVGDFESEVNRLVGLAQAATSTALDPVIVNQAIRLVRRSLDQLSPLADGRLQVDFSYSNLLLELMQNATLTVFGTSPVEVEEVWWTLPLYQQYLDIQQEIVRARGVNITRVFMAPALTPDVRRLMEVEASHGINVRFASTNRIQQELQEAYVLFDQRILHRTIPSLNQDDDNFFSENPADLEEYNAKFRRLIAFSQSLDSLAEQ